MKKRGELTSTEIITIVLSIIGFVIAITFLLVFLDLDKESRDEICSFSVLSRATAPETVNTFIPLKCQTTKYCIGKECTEFIGEPHVEDISLPVNDEEELKETNTIEFKTQTDELAVIFTQIKPKSYTEVLDNLGKVGGTIAGSAFLTPGVNKALLSGPGLALTGVTAAGVTIYSMSNVWKGKAVAGGYCGTFTNREEAKKEGCS